MTGLYVHVPFCARACPYCDFDFEVGRNPDVGAYFDGLDRELRGRADARSKQDVQTVYVGGGTPSLLPLSSLARLTDWIARSYDVRNAVEYTVEANPEHVTAELCLMLREHGVDRLSLGVQTFDAGGLRELGRVHDAAQAQDAIAAARGAGLRVAVDLIVGWRGQTPQSLARDIGLVVAADVGHLSVYALTIEGSVPWQRLVRRGLREPPDPDAQAELLLAAEAALSQHGFRHYEVSNFALPGAEAQHNCGYWSWADYVGLGPSASSAWFDQAGRVHRRSNAVGLARWGRAPARPDTEEVLDPEASAVEGLWTGLRRLDGLDVARFCARFPAVDAKWVERRTLVQVERGNLEWLDHGASLRVAPGRWLWHDSISAALM